MAIKAKSAKSDVTQLPAEIEDLVKKGFTEQQMSSYYEDQFKATKTEALDLIKKSEDITIEVGTALKTEYGSINLVERETKVIDKDKLISLVDAGKISIVEVLSCVSTFKNEDLEKALGTSTFKTLATVNVGQSFTWKISPDYKAECESVISGAAPTPKPTRSAPAAPVAVEKEIKKASAKSSAASAKARLKSVDDILKGK